MAVNRIENPNFDQSTLTNDGIDGGAGGTTSNGGGVGINAPQDTTLTNLFVFNISSNESTFTTLLDGEVVGNNKRIRISRDSLSKSSKRIEVKKNGYSNNEYYIIEMVDDGSPIIINPNIEQPLGISTKDVVLTKYTKKPNRVVGTPKSIKNVVSSDLSFTFNKLRGGDEYEEPKSYNTSFNISVGQASVSVLKNGNKNAEFFPKKGASSYSDVEGTKYTIRSSDTTLYRITNILYTSATKEQSLSANVGESLEITVTLNSDYIFDIIVEEVFQGTPAKDPQIQLVKTDARTYNLNSKAGVPLMIRKNADVQSITVIVGDDVLEFDDLDSGDLCGITIPHNVFDKIGKYNVKIFPFSFDDYEQQVRPVQPAEKVESKRVETKFNVKEEVKLPPIDVNDKYNPYTPKGSGGGGSRPVTLDPIQEALNRTEETFGVRDNSFVDRPVDNRNVR